MKSMEIDNKKLETAWDAGPDRYIIALTDAYLEMVGGSLTPETMERLTADQHTLLAYRILLDEVCEGGFIQLIQNGYGPYVLGGPFPMMMKKEWGFVEFGKFMYEVRKEYNRTKEQIEADMDEDTFMGLYVDLDTMNNFGDDFLDDYEEEMTPAIAAYVRENESRFVL